MQNEGREKLAKNKSLSDKIKIEKLHKNIKIRYFEITATLHNGFVLSNNAKNKLAIL